MVLVYIYRYTFIFKNILSSVKDNTRQPIQEDVSHDISFYSGRVSKLNESSGKWGVAILGIATYFIISAVTLAIFTLENGIGKTIIDVIFSATVLIRWTYFVTASLSLTAAFILFNYFYWNGGRNDLAAEYLSQIKKDIFRLLFITLLIQAGVDISKYDYTSNFGIITFGFCRNLLRSIADICAISALIRYD